YGVSLPNKRDSVVCGRPVNKQDSLATSSHAGHELGHTLLWDGTQFLNQDLLQFVSEVVSVTLAETEHPS
ncbi:hypothetical protein ILYODFUR_017370, partial [Ilyodon furcidens]